MGRGFLGSAVDRQRVRRRTRRNHLVDARNAQGVGDAKVLLNRMDMVEVEFGDVEALAEELVGLGAGVLAVAPDELRASVVRRLRAVAEVTG